MTVEEFRELARKQEEERQRLSGGSKYHATRYNGYASKKEYNRAQQLKMLAKSGVISDLREQVRYLLIPGAHNPETGYLVERPVHYVADFVYTDNETGKTVVEDTKGFKTPEYIIKRKLMLFIHSIRIKEI